MTDLKYNRRNHAPKAASHKLETNLQQTKSALIDTFDQYTKKHCDKNGDLKNSNMDADFKEGLKGLKEKVKTEGERVMMPTDKTNGLSYETKDSYKLAAKDHIIDDKIVSDKTRKNIEANYNGISKGMLRFLRVGEARKQDNRLVEAVSTHNTTVPTMKLTGKDHKHIEDPKINQ